MVEWWKGEGGEGERMAGGRGGERGWGKKGEKFPGEIYLSMHSWIDIGR